MSPATRHSDRAGHLLLLLMEIYTALVQCISDLVMGRLNGVGKMGGGVGGRGESGFSTCEIGKNLT